MISRWIRAAALPAVLALGPAPALAFETVDVLPWPSAGAFYPGYVGDPVRPWSIFAYGGAMYDSNVRRTPVGETSDIISRLGIGGRYTARVIGRQSVALDGYVEYRNYDELSQFDHTAYGARGQWLWELGNQLSGVASARRTHRLADIGETTVAVKDLVTEDHLDLTGGYRFHPNWRLTGGVGTTRVAHDGRDLDTTHSVGFRGGLEYVSGLGNTVGLEWRRAEGDAPVDETFFGTPFEDNEYTEDSVAVTLAYALGAQLRVRGRLGYTDRTYTQVSAADFSGTTGRAAIEWLPSVRTRFILEAFREPDPVIDADALYVDRRGFLFGFAWAITYKLVFTTTATNERRLYTGEPLVVATGAPQRDETVRVLRFGLGWEPERHWQFGTSLDLGTRESNFLGRDYDYTAIALNLRYSF
jgi:hypothetical protein